MVCLTNCSCGAWFIFFLVNAIICPQTMVYSKEKIVCYRILQSDNCTSFKTNKTAQWNGSCPQLQSTSLYILSYVFTRKSDHFSCSFYLTKFRKKNETNDYVEWKKKRSFTSCGHSSRSTVFWRSPIPENMNITIPFKNCARGRFCWGGGGGRGGMRYFNVVSELAISSECEYFDHLLVPSSG